MKPLTAPPAPRRTPGTWHLLGALVLGLAFTAPLPAQTTIMPLGDSITAGGGAGQRGPGYRGVLYRDLTDAGASFSFVGLNTHANGPTPGLPSLPAGYLSHNGYGSYTLADILSNLAANGSKHSSPNHGGYWLTGGNPDTDVTGEATDRPAIFPNVVLLMAGTNDADYSNGTNLAAMETRMHDLLTWFRTNRPGTRVIVGTVVPWNKIGDVDAVATDRQVTEFNGWLKGTEMPAFPGYRLVDMNPLFRNADGTTNPALFTGGGDGIHPNSAGYTLMAHAWHKAIMDLGVIRK